MLHQGVRVRDIATNAKWKPVSELDMMLVHVIMPKAEEVAAPADAAAAAHRGAGRARGHEEGQEGRRGRREGREEGRQEEGREEEIAAREGNCRTRQSGPEVQGDAAQRRLRGGRRARAGGRGPFESAPAEALIAKWRPTDVALVKPLTFMNLSGQAVGELPRYFKIEIGDLIVIVDEVHPAARQASRAEAGIGRRSQRAEVGHRAPRGRGSRGCDSASGGGDERDLADHVLSRFETDERGRSSA